MRRRWMLMNRLLVVAALAGAQVALASAPADSTEGMTLLDSSGDGATLYVTGVLTQGSFETQQMRVAGSRLAGRSSDPDQFRIYLLDAQGGKLGLVKTWSPLLALEWDLEGQREAANNQEKAIVTLPIPVTLALDQVVLRWSEGKEIARVSVGEVIRQFCKEMPKNPACGAPLK